MSSITIHNTTKQFDDVTAVNDVTLEAHDGEFLVLVGPSGCGKSTTLRLLAGLESVTDGTIRIGDRDITDVPAGDRNVAMVFQNYALYPHMTARRNITFGMKSAGDFNDEEINTRVEEATRKLDIRDLLDRKPSELSGGEKQRVAIGRAIVRDPDVFLMDEPLSNLDAKLRVRMRAELSQLHADLETTTIYVTHDQVEAMTLGDRVAVMNDGAIEQVAAPQTLYDRPATRFVAEFIGDPAMNTFRVDITHNEGYQAQWENGCIQLPYSSKLEELSGETVLLGVRPEDIHLALDPSERQFDFSVDVAEPLGDTTLLTGTVGQNFCKVQLAPRSDVEPNDTVSCYVDPQRVHLFDPSTGDAHYHSVDHGETDANQRDLSGIKQ